MNLPKCVKHFFILNHAKILRTRWSRASFWTFSMSRITTLAPTVISCHLFSRFFDLNFLILMSHQFRVLNFFVFVVWLPNFAWPKYIIKVKSLPNMKFIAWLGVSESVAEKYRRKSPKNSAWALFKILLLYVLNLPYKTTVITI